MGSFRHIKRAVDKAKPQVEKNKAAEAEATGKRILELIPDAATDFDLFETVFRYVEDGGTVEGYIDELYDNAVRTQAEGVA